MCIRDRCRTAGTANPPKEPRSCAECGASFIPRVPAQTCCSPSCARKLALSDDAKNRLRLCACGRAYVPRTAGQTRCSPGCLTPENRGRHKIATIGVGVGSSSSVRSHSKAGSTSRSAAQDRYGVSLQLTCPSCGIQQDESSFPKDGEVCLDCLGAIRAGRLSGTACGYCEYRDAGKPECGKCLKYAQQALDAWRLQVVVDGAGLAAELVLPQRVWDATDRVCCICMLPTIEGTESGVRPVLEHLQPKERGGTHTYQNIGCAHQFCSAAKADGVKLADIRARVIGLIEAECKR